MISAEAGPEGTASAAGRTTAAKRKAGGLFAFKAMTTAVAGSMLSAVVAIAQLWYSEHLEVLRRQSAEGVEYQERLLDLTGRIEVELSGILADVRLGTPQSLARARERVRGPLELLYGEWRSSRLLLRNRGAEIYGRDVGELVYGLSERAYDVDDCNVVVRLGSDAANTDCLRRRSEERRFLDSFRTEIMQSETLEPFRRSQRSPVGFQANLEVVRTILWRYLGCATAADQARASTRCENMEDSRAILIARSDLVGTARTNLATAIMEQASLR